MSIQTSLVNVLTNSMNVKKRTDTRTFENNNSRRWCQCRHRHPYHRHHHQQQQQQNRIHTLSKQSHVEIVLYTHSYCMFIHTVEQPLKQKNPPIRMCVRVYRIKHQSTLMLKSDACVFAYVRARLFLLFAL